MSKRKRILTIVAVVVAIWLLVAVIGGIIIGKSSSNANPSVEQWCSAWGKGSEMYDICLQSNAPCDPNANPRQLTCSGGTP